MLYKVVRFYPQIRSDKGQELSFLGHSFLSGGGGGVKRLLGKRGASDMTSPQNYYVRSTRGGHYVLSIPMKE